MGIEVKQSDSYWLKLSNASIRVIISFPSNVYAFHNKKFKKTKKKPM